MKHLILTGLEDYSTEYRENYKFLGPWCFLGSSEREELLDEYDFTKIFSGPNEIKVAADYILEYSLRLVSELAGELNRIHGRSYSVAYWHTLLMPWLLTVVQAYYERYKHLTRVIEEGGGYIVMLMDTTILPKINGTREYIKFNYTPEGNHYIFSVFLEKLLPVGWDVNPGVFRLDVNDPGLTDPGIKKSRDLRRIISRELSLMMSRLSGIYIEGISGMGFFDKMFLSFGGMLQRRGKRKELLPLPLHRKEDNLVGDCPGKEKRCMRFSHDVRKNTFEEVVAEQLPKLLPVIFFEEYFEKEKNAVTFIRKMSGKVTKFVIGPLLGGYDPMKFIVAMHKEKGGRVYISQHGACYGTSLAFPFMAGIEYLNSDGFITWGWREHSNYPVKTIPLSSPMLSKVAGKVAKKDNGKIVLVGTLVRVFSDRMASNPQPCQCTSFRKSKVEFVENLPLSIRNNFYYRPYPSEVAGLMDEGYMKRAVPGIQILKGSLGAFLPSARCVVLDHPGTTLNITIAMNVPTVLFWDKEQWAMCSQAEAVFQHLREVDILHDTPKSAAIFVEENWHTLKLWWQSKKVQESRRYFCEHYARFNEKWRQEWISSLFGI